MVGSKISDEVIRVRQLVKTYRIWDDPVSRLKSPLLSAMADWFPHGSRPNKSLLEKASSHYRDFHALDDVQFSINRGESFAILGRNGAGKSTLLQIIVGTLQPTSGDILVKGKIAALLELGSGFNPEFTGRENIFLNCAVLGYNRKETEKLYDSIVEFADIGDFVEQPVKTYSSGMMLRLAFAVQTTVKPDILIIDEALAVGDIFFQAKCMQRLRELTDSGVTLLFVSHDTGTVKQLCDKALLLKEGKMVMLGEAGKVCDSYLTQQVEDRNKAQQLANNENINKETKETELTNNEKIQSNDSESDKLSIEHGSLYKVGELFAGQNEFDKRAAYNRVGNNRAEILNAQMLKGNDLCKNFDYGDEVTLRFIIKFNEDIDNLNVGYKIKTLQSTDIIYGDTRLNNEMNRAYRRGRVYIFEWKFRLTLMHDKYVVQCAIANPPSVSNNDWIFIDVVPICYEFSMNARKEGMLGGYVSWNDELYINALEP